MNKTRSRRFLTAFGITLCLIAVLAPSASFAFNRPAAAQPVDSRQYIISGSVRICDASGNTIGTDTVPSLGFTATISPAAVQCFDPQGQRFAAYSYHGQTRFLGSLWRQYLDAEGAVMLVGDMAQLMNVVPQPDGKLVILDIREQSPQGIGQARVSYKRPLWASRDIPVFTIDPPPVPRDDELFRISFPKGGDGNGSNDRTFNGQGPMPLPAPTPTPNISPFIMPNNPGVMPMPAPSPMSNNLCYACKTTGYCAQCKGTGFASDYGVRTVCGACNGTGKCSLCGGTGHR